MSLTKILNGVSVPCSPAEETAITAEWAANATPPPKIWTGGQWIFLSADFVTGSAAMVDVPGMVLSVSPNVKYKFEFVIPFRSAATTTGIGLSLTAPASPTTFAAQIDIPLSAALGTAAIDTQQIVGNDAGAPTPSIDVINADRVAFIRGILFTGAAGGALQLRARSEVAASNITIRKGACASLYGSP